MKPKHMAALAALGLAGVAGLIILWSASRTAAPDTTASPDPGALANDTAHGSTASPAARSGAPTPRPQLPQPAVGSPATTQPEATRQPEAAGQTRPRSAVSTEPGTERAAPRVYVRDDGVLVRDHRTRDAPPMMSATVTRPQRSVTKVAPTTVLAVRNAMRPIVRECLGDIPISADADPRLQSHVDISIADTHLTIDDVRASTRDLDEPVSSELRACVIQRMKSVTLEIPGGSDVTGHTLTLPFRLRR
jgi:hypothetical protein